MKNKVLWFLTILPIIVTIFAVQFMEDKIPAHYDMMGNIDRWGSKYESFILPVIIVVMSLFWLLFLRYYRRKQLAVNDEKIISEAYQNEKVIYYVAVGMALLFNIMHYSFMYIGFIETRNNMQQMAADINIIVNVTLGIFLIVIGNIMPKSKLNSIVGVRTKWSMKNDVTWAKSNRIGGILMVVSGILVIIESIIFGGILSTFILLGIIIIMGIVTTVYSYFSFNTLKK